MEYKFAAIQENGAVILRSSMEQDARCCALEMMKSVQVQYPTAEFCLSFRTFDGDQITQFMIRHPRIGYDATLPRHGAKLVFPA